MNDYVFAAEAAEILGVALNTNPWAIIRRDATRFRRETGQTIAIHTHPTARCNAALRPELTAFAEWRRATCTEATLEASGYIYGNETAVVMDKRYSHEVWVIIERHTSRYRRETGNQLEKVVVGRRNYILRAQLEDFCTWYDANIRGRNKWAQRRVAKTADRRATNGHDTSGIAKNGKAVDEPVAVPAVPPSAAGNGAYTSLPPERRRLFASTVKRIQQRLADQLAAEIPLWEEEWEAEFG